MEKYELLNAGTRIWKASISSLFVFLIVCMMACGKSQEHTSDKRIAAGEDVKSTTDANSICNLMNQADEFSGKTVRVQTKLYFVGRSIYVGDERCVPRHPVFDVNVEAQFVKELCASRTSKDQKLCSLLNRSNLASNESLDVDYYVSADITAKFEVFEPKRRFTVGGKRFRIEIFEIENLTEFHATDREE